MFKIRNFANRFIRHGLDQLDRDIHLNRYGSVPSRRVYMRYHSVGHCFGLWEKLDIVYQSHIGATNRVSALMPIEYIAPL